MRKWKYSTNPHSAFMSDDKYFARWSKQSDIYILFEHVDGEIVCMVDRKKLVKYCKDNDLNCYTYLLYLFERYIDRYNFEKRIVKVKENKCGACHHLIFKDYKHGEGFCDKLRISRRFNYPCIHEEEMS